MPQITVLIPMYNAADTILDALESIVSERDVDLEVVVVDDRSTDGSAERVRSLGDPRVRLVEGPHEGIAAAANAGLAQAGGEILMRCDADDRFVPGRIARQAVWLDGQPEYGAVCGYVQTIDSKGRVIANFDALGASMELTDELRRGNAYIHFNAWAIRTELIRRAGSWRPFFICSEDVDLQLRLGEHARVWYEHALAYQLRIRESSITHQKSEAFIRFYKDAARTFQRQRLSGRADDLALGQPPEPPASDEPGARIDVGEQIRGQLIGQAWHELAHGHRLRAIRTAGRACWRAPSRWMVWRNLIVVMVKSLPGLAPRGRREDS
ncbi:MAG: glycosyltransferase [Nitrospiraceae bacterium]|nr:glycosyltransferase [Nitrospiraceae bacterium]